MTFAPISVWLLPSIRCFSDSAVTLTRASPRRAASGEHTVTVKRHVFCKVAADLPQVPPVLTSSFGVSSRLDIIKMIKPPLWHQESWEKNHCVSHYSRKRRLRWCRHNIFFDDTPTWQLKTAIFMKSPSSSRFHLHSTWSFHPSPPTWPLLQQGNSS